MSKKSQVDKNEEVSGKLMLNRRGFITTAMTAGAIAAVGSSLIGCGSDSSSDSSDTTASSYPDGYMCNADWLGDAPTISDSDIAETVTVDVVVCGGGHAGTQAALAAAQAGVTVAVIEQQAADTFTLNGDDICSYNSEFMIDRGFGPYDTNEITAEYVRRANGRCSTEVIRLFVENSGEMMDNLASIVPDTSNVFDFDDSQCIVQTAYDKPDGSYYPIEQAGYKAWASTIQTIGTVNPTAVNGRDDLSRLTELETYSMLAAVDAGATWYNEYTATVLVQDSDGNVTGVIAEGTDGTYTKFVADKGVILATGDFSADPSMCWQLLTDATEWAARAGKTQDDIVGMTTNTGVGQKMACWAGGYLEPSPRPTLPNAPMVSFGPWGTSPMLWLNSNGDRFMNEAMAGLAVTSSIRQPTGSNVAITDSKYMQSIQGAGIDHGAPNWGWSTGMDTFQAAMEALATGADGGDVPGLEIASTTMSMTSTVYAADTLEELLGYLGYADDALQAALDSITAYNELCSAGADTQYNKEASLMISIDEPPFYGALQSTSGLYGVGLCTLAGLMTDNNLNVLQADLKTTISGLYAVGNCLGQRYGNAYSTPSAGNSMGMAMTHGRVAGKIVAAL